MPSSLIISKIRQSQSLYYRCFERKYCQGKFSIKGVNLVRTKEHVCKEKVVFAEIEAATSRMADQAKTRATDEPTLSAKVAQEIMVSAEQEFSGMIWKFWAYVGHKYFLSEMCICMFMYK